MIKSSRVSLESLPNQDELKLKDLIFKVKSLLGIFKQNSIVIFAVSILFSSVGFLVSSTSNPNYKAELRFILKSDGSASGMSSMLGGLGVMLGGNSMGSALERTVEIVASDRIIGRALLTKVIFKNQEEYLINHFIEIQDLKKKWESDSLLKAIYFEDKDTIIEKMSYANRKAIKIIESMLIPKTGDGIISKTFDKKSGVVTLAATHENEEFSILLSKSIFNELRDFYVEQMITSAANNVLILQRKVDSIKNELSNVQAAYARNTDQSFGLLFQEDKVDLRKLAFKEQMLTAMYSEAQKNLETFKFMNDSAIPTLTVIDMPYSPLTKIQKSTILFTFGGFFLGAFFTFFLILARLWYKNLMAS